MELLYVFDVKVNWVFFALVVFKFMFDFSVLTAKHSHSQLIVNGIFLLSATKYCIWPHRNSIVHNKVIFDSDCIINSDDRWQKVLGIQLKIYCVVYFRT